MKCMEEKRNWFVAYVRSCQERNVARRLSSRGLETYIPIQKQKRKWSDRIKMVDHLVLPRIVFVFATEAERLESLKTEPYLTAYMTDHGTHKPVIVPQRQLDVFRQMVEGSGREVRVRDNLAPGDSVRIASGPLQGLECQLVTVNSQRCLAVSLGALGSATIDLSIDDVIKISQ